MTIQLCFMYGSSVLPFQDSSCSNRCAWMESDSMPVVWCGSTVALRQGPHTLQGREKGSPVVQIYLAWLPVAEVGVLQLICYQSSRRS